MIRLPKFLLLLLGGGLMVYFCLLFLAHQNEWDIGRLDVIVELFTLPALLAAPALLILGSFVWLRDKTQRHLPNLVGLLLLFLDIVLIAVFSYSP